MGRNGTKVSTGMFFLVRSQGNPPPHQAKGGANCFSHFGLINEILKKTPNDFPVEI